MSFPSPTSVTPVSPVKWLPTFAYTPESARVTTKSDSQRSDLAEENSVSLSDEDVLPTRFHLAQAVNVSGPVVPNPGRGALQRDVSDSYFSPPSSTVPAKRKRSTRSRDAPSRSLTIPGSLSAEHVWSSQRRARKMCANKGGKRGQDTGPSHTPTPSTRRGAIEIISKKRSPDRLTHLRTSPTESARKTASSHYPSPLACCASKDVPMHDNPSSVPSAHVLRSIVVRASPESTLPRRRSKYFARVSAGQTLSVLEDSPVLTPPNSPLLTIPVYVESSDFEYPPFDDLIDELGEGTVGDSRHIPTWYNNPGLYDDLIVMLRRLKPILVQESVQDDPWKVLIAVRLLNVTTGKAAVPVFYKILSRWPTPQGLVHAPHDELVELLRPLGLYNKRARWLKDVSERFLEDRPASNTSTMSLSDERSMVDASYSHYPGVGPYALDSLRIFCTGDKNAWKHVMPSDKELVRYLRWRWAVKEGKIWYPDGKGVIGNANVPYLITLVDELAVHYDGAIGGEGYMYQFCNDLCEVFSGQSMEFR